LSFMYRDEFRKKFPHLVKEIENNKMNVRIHSVRTKPVEEEAESLSGYMPDTVDFIRRCETVEEALDIISYLEKRGELSLEQAVRFRAQLKLQGLRSFGPKKEIGYYEKRGEK
jgi:hypothetical protein